MSLSNRSIVYLFVAMTACGKDQADTERRNEASAKPVTPPAEAPPPPPALPTMSISNTRPLDKGAAFVIVDAGGVLRAGRIDDPAAATWPSIPVASPEDVGNALQWLATSEDLADVGRGLASGELPLNAGELEDSPTSGGSGLALAEPQPARRPTEPASRTIRDFGGARDTASRRAAVVSVEPSSAPLLLVARDVPARLLFEVAAESRAWRLGVVADGRTVAGPTITVKSRLGIAGTDLWAPDLVVADLGGDGLALRTDDHGALAMIPWSSGDLARDVRAALVEQVRGDFAIAVDGSSTVDQLVRALDAALATGAEHIDLRDWQRKPAAGRHVWLGRPTTGADRVPDDVLVQYLSPKQTDLLACYEAALGTRADVGGVVEIAFTINPDGTVTDVRADGVDAGLADCTERVIATLQFPRLRDPTPIDVVEPLAFRAF